MDIQFILIAVGSMAGLGLLFAIGLAIANKKLQVEEDPRVLRIIDALPGANCGGCGLPGCAAFGEAVSKGKAPIDGCVAGSEDVVAEIASIMGVEVSSRERETASCACQGGLKEIALKGKYLGAKSCVAANLVAGGQKLCEFGCIGLGDCAAICPFDAIVMLENCLPGIDREKCTGCGKCVSICPRNIMHLHSASHRTKVLCQNHDIGRYAMKVCTRACIACGLCEKNCPVDAIHVLDNLAVIDYGKCINCGICAKVCPNQVIEQVKKKKKKAEASSDETASGN